MINLYLKVNQGKTNKLNML